MILPWGLVLALLPAWDTLRRGSQVYFQCHLLTATYPELSSPSAGFVSGALTTFQNTI